MAYGQVLNSPAVATDYYYGPWMGRRGDSGVFVVDVISINLTGVNDLKVVVETKNTEDVDADMTSLGDSGAITMSGLKVFEVGPGFLELYRYRYEFASSGKAGTDWAHCRMLAPSWRTN